MNKKRFFLLSLGMIIFIVLIFKTVTIDDLKVIASVENLLIVIILGILINIIIPLKAYRWKNLVESNNIDEISFKESMIQVGSSFFLGSITPSRIGEYSRVLSSKTKKKELTAVFTIEYLSDLIALLVIPLISSMVILYKIEMISIVIAILLIVIVSLIILFSMDLPDRLFLKLFPKRKGFIENKKEVLRLFFRYSKNIRTNIGSIIVGIIMYLILYSIGWILLISFGLDISYSTAVAGFSIGQLVGILTFIPLGLGTREASILGLFVALGYSSGSITSSLVIIRLITFVPIGLGYLQYIKLINKKFS